MCVWMCVLLLEIRDVTRSAERGRSGARALQLNAGNMNAPLYIPQRYDDAPCRGGFGSLLHAQGAAPLLRDMCARVCVRAKQF